MTREEFSQHVNNLTVDELRQLAIRMNDMLIVKHLCLTNVYDLTEHLSDDLSVALTEVATAGLNSGIGNEYDRLNPADEPLHLQNVPGVVLPKILS